MRTEPEETETNAENLEREDKIERVPERTFGGTRERLRRSKEVNLYQMRQEIKDRARIEFAPVLFTGYSSRSGVLDVRKLGFWAGLNQPYRLPDAVSGAGPVREFGL